MFSVTVHFLDGETLQGTSESLPMNGNVGFWIRTDVKTRIFIPTASIKKLVVNE